jgi:2-polyprenyl-3-methyl-5-hydroxy-6-metoxy-1,4-benzoquinol methylase
MDTAIATTEPTRSDWTSCPVCGGTASTTYVAFRQVAFVRCAQCTTVYKQFETSDIRPATFYEKDYFHGRKSGRDKRFEHRVNKAARWIRSVMEFGPTRSLLDVGCSLGYVVAAGDRLGLASAGSDISQYAVEVCRERGLRAEVGTLDHQPFRDGEFDLITMKHVIEHTPTPAVALTEVRRLLSPGGRVLIAVPNLTYWKGLFRRHAYRYFRPDDLGQQHYVYYTAATMRRLLESNGFEVLVTSKAFYRPKIAAQSPWSWVREACRFVGMKLGYGLVGALLQKREVFVVARKRPE